MRRVRPATRALVTSLDLTRFVTGTSDLSMYSWGKTLSETLRVLPSTFPRLRCILLDDHPDVDTDALLSTLDPGPLLLSIPQCQAKLPGSFFASPCLRSLVYLDVSGMPGSLKNSLAQATVSPVNLPRLRILKARGREMDDSTASLLLKTFEEQLWSLDLSHNKLTDAILDDIHRFAFPALGSRTGNFAVEGRLVHLPGRRSTSFGPFCFVDESDWSATFSHPQRYLADAPAYTSSAHETLQAAANPRLDGRVKIRPDSPGAVKVLLSGGPGHRSPSLEDISELDICRGHQGITHLYLNGNNISAAGLARMIRSSPGQLQHLECESMSFTVHEAARPAWLAPGKGRLWGILGLAHIFRPVFSANLQVLRIHHSLVTQLLTLELDGVSSMTNLWLAEACLLPQAEMAYPEAFVPDMNPRLRSLVLMQIPRLSTGPLIEKLINFLKLASVQERAIQDAKGTNTTRRGPSTLLGLRHIRLEFEPDPRGAEGLLGENLDYQDSLDAEELLSEEFSFFGSSSWTSSPKPPVPSSERRHNSPALRNTPTSQEAARPVEQSSLACLPGPTDGDDRGSSYLPYTLNSPSGSRTTIPVWIGPSNTTTTNPSASTSPLTPAVREYSRLVRNHAALQTDPVPASPAHIAAGVPPQIPGGQGPGQHTYIFSPAWEAMLLPRRLPPPSSSPSSFDQRGTRGTRQGTRGMRDVVEAIKAYRAGTRAAYEAACRKCEEKEKESRRSRGEWVVPRLGAPHFHWTGRLEVAVMDEVGHFHQSRFWR